MTLLITISSDSEYAQITLKNRNLEYAKAFARTIWPVMENPKILVIRELEGQVLFTHQSK